MSVPEELQARFVSAVLTHFSFLEGQGFEASASEDGVVEFRSSGVCLAADYSPYEFEANFVLRTGTQNAVEAFPLGLFLPRDGDEAPVSGFLSSSAGEIEELVAAVAAVTQSEMQPALRGHEGSWAQARKRAHANARAEDVRFRWGPALADADEAWTTGDRAAAVELYASVDESALSETQRRRLSYGRRHA